MSTMMERMKHRRAMNRRYRAINKALRLAPSASMRDELLEIVSRY